MRQTQPSHYGSRVAYHPVAVVGARIPNCLTPPYTPPLLPLPDCLFAEIVFDPENKHYSYQLHPKGWSSICSNKSLVTTDQIIQEMLSIRTLVDYQLFSLFLSLLFPQPHCPRNNPLPTFLHMQQLSSGSELVNV